MFMWYRSADTLFWQLTIDHNIYVQYQVAGSHTTELERLTFYNGCPVVQADGRTVTWLLVFRGWISNQIFVAKGLVGLVD